MKVAFLTNTPAPYRLPFYEEWAKRDDLVVLFDQANASRRSWILDPRSATFSFEILKSRALTLKEERSDFHFTENRIIYFSTKAISALRRLKPDVVVSAEFGARSLMAATYCRMSKTPLVLTSESTCHTERLTRGFRPWLRRRLVRQAAGFWSNGKDSTDLLVRYGAKRPDVQEGMTGVDTELFAGRVAAKLPEREAIRQRLGAQGVTFLVLGSLSGRKGVPQLRNAAAKLAAERPHLKFTLVFLGNGDELPLTEKWAAQQPANLKVIFPGFVQIDGVPEFMVAADWGLMPTLEDCWPLSTLEMLVAGLPQLFSIYNGGTAELCREGVTGFKFDPASKDAFSSALEKAVQAPWPRLAEPVVHEFRNFYAPAAQARRASESVLRAYLKKE
jgi:glycosyltransferase involved in cell wall biosynthesis